MARASAVMYPPYLGCSLGNRSVHRNPSLKSGLPSSSSSSSSSSCSSSSPKSTESAGFTGEKFIIQHFAVYTTRFVSSSSKCCLFQLLFAIYFLLVCTCVAENFEECNAHVLSSNNTALAPKFGMLTDDEWTKWLLQKLLLLFPKNRAFTTSTLVVAGLMRSSSS